MNVTSIPVEVTLKNERNFPVLVPGEEWKAYGYGLTNLNGTNFTIPSVPIPCDYDVPPRILINAHERISFQRDIAKMNWYYPYWKENENPDIQIRNYTTPFNFNVPGVYTFLASHTCYTNPMNYEWSSIRSNTIVFRIS